MVLEEGVIEGRRTFANMLKYIKMTASSNFGNVFSVLVASAFVPFLPMMPMQLLVQNMLYDISQIAIPFDNVDEELLRQPQRWQPTDIGRFMVFLTNQFNLRHHDLPDDVVCIRCQYPGSPNIVSVGLVHRRFADADPDRSPDPHAEDTFLPEPCFNAVDGDDRHHYGGRHIPTDGAVGALLQTSILTAFVFRVSTRDLGSLRRADTGDEGDLPPLLRLAVSLIDAGEGRTALSVFLTIALRYNKVV
jgi:hypothetical protein